MTDYAEAKLAIERELDKLGPREFGTGDIRTRCPGIKRPEYISMILAELTRAGRLNMRKAGRHSLYTSKLVNNRPSEQGHDEALPPEPPKPRLSAVPSPAPKPERAKKPPPAAPVVTGDHEQCPYCSKPCMASELVELSPPACRVRWPEHDRDVSASPVDAEDGLEIFTCIPCRRFFTRVSFVVEVLSGQAAAVNQGAASEST